MHDEQLREGLAAWLEPTQQAPVPDVTVIKHRLRRRRARRATAGTALCALAAGTVALIHVTGLPMSSELGGTSNVNWPPCRASQLRVDPVAAEAPGSSGISMEQPPITYLLQISNTGRAACTLDGWPKLSISSPPTLRTVPVSYGTVSVWMGSSVEESRTVEPTRVALLPQAQAVAAVTVTYPPNMTNCASTVWSVTPPHGSRPTLVRGSAASAAQEPGSLEVCRFSDITVSPVYPADVPATQNYPAAAPHQSPAFVSTSPPTTGTPPQAAPYFVVIHRPDAVVYDWQTGRVTAVIRPPAAAPGGFTGVAAEGDDQSFVLAAGSPSRFYQLVLSQQGTLGQPLTPLPVPSAAGPGTLFAVSNDGSELALALPARAGLPASEIMIVSLVTGDTHLWRSPSPGTVWALSWADPGSSPAIAWAGHNELLFGWTDPVARQQSGLRLLDTSGPSTSLLSSRLVVSASVRAGPLTTLGNPLIGSAGSAVFATMTTHTGRNTQAAVVKFSAATGRPLAIVTPLAAESGPGTWCGALWANPSASYALAACGSQGEINGTRFTRQNLHFPAQSFNAAQNYFAW